MADAAVEAPEMKSKLQRWSGFGSGVFFMGGLLLMVDLYMTNQEVLPGVDPSSIPEWTTWTIASAEVEGFSRPTPSHLDQRHSEMFRPGFSQSDL